MGAIPALKIGGVALCMAALLCALPACVSGPANLTNTSGGGTGGTVVSGGGGTGGGSGGGEVGGGGPCGGPGACDDGKPCTEDSCNTVTGECDHLTLDGVAAPDSEQTTADCRLVLCEAGTPSVVNDDTDLPDDGNGCTEDTCNSGVPLNDPLPTGTACTDGGGSVCDDAGHCVECNAPSDCTGLPPDDECQQRTCTAGACGQSFTAADTPLAVQTSGDCQTGVCDGSGGTQQKVDDTDLPNDNNDCTADQCSGGVPANPPLSQGTGCQAGVCDGNGQCIGCNDPADCSGSDTFCQARTCTSGVCGVNYTAQGTALPPQNQTSGDCLELQCDGMGNSQAVAKDTDLPPDEPNECTDQACNGGVPSFPPTPLDSPCTVGGTVCDGSGSCVQCNSASQCPPAPVCQLAICSSNSCGTANESQGTPAPPNMQTTGDCQLVVCDGNGGTTSQAQDTDVPMDGNECTQDICSSGVPSNPPEPAETSCTANPGWVCNGDVNNPACVECATDNQCTAPATCDQVSWICAAPPTTLTAGAHTFDTDTGQLDGVVQPGWNGTTWTVGDLDIQSGAVLTVSGSQPLDIQSQGNVTLAGSIDVAGLPGGPGGSCNSPGGAGGLAGPGGSVGGAGGGYAPGSGTPDGGAGLGPGGGGGGVAGASNGAAGGGGAGHLNAGTAGVAQGGTAGAAGSAYASLPPLIGGSGGGGGSVEKDGGGGLTTSDDGGAGGGGGGGAVRITATGTMIVGGSIDAHGGDGGSASCSAGSGGGGSGGAIQLLASTLPDTTAAVLNVAGGLGALGGADGGDGSVGRIDVGIQ